PSEHESNDGGTALKFLGLNSSSPLSAGVALASAAMPFDQDEDNHDSQHRQSDLGGAGQVGSGDPRCVYRYGQRLYAQEFRSADIVQCFKQRQAYANSNGWAGHGQGHTKESAAA